MQKKIIALAIAGLVSGAAFAQSNVTIYGKADAGYAYSKSGSNGDENGSNSAITEANKNPTFSGIDSGNWNGSRIGFMGEEALGNGVKAIFRMGYGSDIDGGNAGGLYKTRWAYVGVDTPYGEVTLGKLKSAAEAYYGDNSANGKNSNGALNVLAGAYVKNLGGVISGDNTYLNNAIAFQSKSYDGFSGRVMYGFGEANKEAYQGTDNSSGTNGIAGISGKYNNGPLNIDAMYYTKLNQAASYDVKDYHDEYNGKATNEWLLGASYDFKVVKAFASYQNTKNKSSRVSDSKATDANKYEIADAKVDVWSVGVSAPVSAAGTVMLEYAKATAKQELNDKKDKSWGLSLSYNHNLSKRTMFYSSLGYVNNNEMEAGVANIAQTGYKGVGFADENSWSFTTGVLHSF